MGTGRNSTFSVRFIIIVNKKKIMLLFSHRAKSFVQLSFVLVNSDEHVTFAFE